MRLRLELNRAEAAEMRFLLDRALNTLPPQEWPSWVQEYLEALEKAERIEDELQAG